MHNSSVPSNQEVPSTGKLIKSTIFAIIISGILLVTVVMPAEYGIDPTGIGKATGLKRMGEIKVSLAKEAAADRVKDMAANTQAEAVKEEVIVTVPEPAQSTLNHEMQVTLAPDEGTEIKVTMTKGSKVQYLWETDGENANFDMHGDSKKLKINYHSYSKGSKQRSEGVLEAAFEGDHGWFWRNRTSEPMTITLKTNGEYSDIKQFK
ncbi:transmembrane anchor protein [Nitrosomonas sp.]|uniref:transmembrane anchor protein n=1 Tax=Nitrosomonas sp. TaxID=42353 RepID=UPI0025D2EFC8|nr:transmembrane anchor protein [Nitrosomonas sp.]